MQLLDATVVAITCHYTFVQTRRMHTKSEPYGKLWTLSDYNLSTQTHPLKQRHHSEKMVSEQKEGAGGNSYFPFNFSVNLKLL